MEQLLISNAVDRSLNRVDFSPLGGHKVYLDSTLLGDCVDKDYLVASTRARILQAGAKLLPKKDNAKVIVELRSGAVGTDESEMFFGVPKMSLPIPMMPISVPEVKLWSRSTQTGTAKIGLVAYEKDTHKILGKAGTILARSTDNKSYFFGMGPWQSGTVRNAVERQLGTPGWYPLPDSIVFALPEGDGTKLRLAASDSEEGADSTNPTGAIQLTSGESPAPLPTEDKSGSSGAKGTGEDSDNSSP